jgi:hypothetical protein
MRMPSDWLGHAYTRMAVFLHTRHSWHRSPATLRAQHASVPSRATCGLEHHSSVGDFFLFFVFFFFGAAQLQRTR